MDFEQIRAFLNVASLKSFSEAGERMFISQPSVSVRIKSLEEELGVILLDRSKAREPVLTDAGKIFLDYAQSIINLQEECRNKLSGERREERGLVNIGASTVPGTYLLPALLAKIRNHIPAIDFKVDILDTGAVLEGIISYSYDIGLVGLIRQDDRLEFVPLLEDELILCAPKGLISEANSEAGLPMQALLKQHLIMRERGSATRQILEKKLLDSGFSLANFNGITYINSLEGIKQAVREGLGVAVLSKLSVNDLFRDGSVEIYKIRDLDLTRQLCLVYHRSRILGGAAERVKNIIAKDFT